MKKLVKVLAMLLALVMCLSVTVLAEGERTPDATCADLFNVYAENGASVEVVGEMINVSISTSESGFFVVVVKHDDGQDPNEDNIIYINQATAADGVVAFSVYASKEAGAAEDCIVLVYGPGMDAAGTKVATVECLTQVGDVNGDDRISSADLIRLAKYIANPNGIEISSEKAADANGDGRVSSADLIRLAKYIANPNGVTLG